MYWIFPRLRHQDITLHKEAVRLHLVVQQIFSVLGALGKEKGLKLCNDVSPEFPLVLADQDRLEQILFNLVGEQPQVFGTGRNYWFPPH